MRWKPRLRCRVESLWPSGRPSIRLSDAVGEMPLVFPFRLRTEKTCRGRDVENDVLFDGVGEWQVGREKLVRREPRDDQGHGPYLTSQESLIDPWNQPYQYQRDGGRNNGTQPDIFTTIPGGKGTIGNWSRKVTN